MWFGEKSSSELSPFNVDSVDLRGFSRFDQSLNQRIRMNLGFHGISTIFAPNDFEISMFHPCRAMLLW